MDVKTRLEGYILQCPVESKLEGVCKVSVEGESLRVHVPVFWTRPRTTAIYKAAENYTLTPEKNQGQSDKIFGRYVDFESHNPTLHKKRRNL